MTFFAAETDGSASVNTSELWKPTNARGLAGAKRAARMMQRHTGTAAHVALKIGTELLPLIVCRPGHDWAEIETSIDRLVDLLPSLPVGSLARRHVVSVLLDLRQTS